MTENPFPAPGLPFTGDVASFEPSFRSCLPLPQDSRSWSGTFPPPDITKNLYLPRPMLASSWHNFFFPPLLASLEFCFMPVWHGEHILKACPGNTSLLVYKEEWMLCAFGSLEGLCWNKQGDWQWGKLKCWEETELFYPPQNGEENFITILKRRGSRVGWALSCGTFEERNSKIFQRKVSCVICKAIFSLLP